MSTLTWVRGILHCEQEIIDETSLSSRSAPAVTGRVELRTDVPDIQPPRRVTALLWQLCGAISRSGRAGQARHATRSDA